MKKFNKILCTAALATVMGAGAMTMTACTKGDAELLQVKPDSIETTVLVNGTHDLSNLVLKVVYENEEVVEIAKNDDMVITPIDTSKLGKQTLTIKYLDLTTTIDINVVAHEGDLYEFLGYEKPEFYTLYQNSSNPENTGMQFDNEFAIGGKTYKVGDDNEFKFLPIITAINSEGDSVTVTEYTSKVTVKENGEEITGEDLANIVNINNTTSMFDFTEAAIGHTYDITVQPVTIAEGATYSPITFKVEVVDAWNVYDVANLSRVEDNAGTASAWAPKKAETGIDNTKIKGIVLHNDLEIKRSDLPNAYFHPAGTIQDGKDIGGTLIDSRSFFTRDIPANETFSIYGNYFTIKTRNEGEDAVPVVEYLTHDKNFGHAAMFSFGGDNNGSPQSQQGNVVLDSLSLKGNGSREGGTNPHNHKGLIGILTSAHTTTIENCLTRAFTTHVIATEAEVRYAGDENMSCTINNSKMIDSFQAMMLAWASRNNNINNSVMKDSGGPLVVATHDNAEDGTHEYSNITVNNSVMESIVGGEEAWFVKNKATSVISLFRALNGLIKMHGADIITQNIGVDKIASFENALNQFNFLAVNMEDDNIFNTDPIESKTTIKDAEGNILSQQDMTSAIISILRQAGITAGSVGGVDSSGNKNQAAAPVFECGGTYVTLDILAEDPMSGLAIVLNDAEVMACLAGTPWPLPVAVISLSDWKNNALCKEGSPVKALIEEKIANFFNGDYVNVYLGGQSLGCTFEMFHLDA